jgi:hypothetical protein
MNKQFGLILHLTRFFLLAFLIQASCTAYAQKTDNNSDRVYGFDPLLYNGKLYYFYPGPGTQGTQFMLNNFDNSGSVSVRGISYTNLVLNYDVYNQQLILRFKNSAGSNSLLILSEAWLESFDLSGSHFILIPDIDTTKRIYQVLGDGNEKVLYFRKKDLLLDSFKNGGVHYFSEIKRTMFVSDSGRITGFKNNRSFISTFDQARQEKIKKYMHTFKVNVKDADDQKMTDLINYCSSLNKP